MDTGEILQPRSPVAEDGAQAKEASPDARQTLCGQLADVDLSVFFLILIVLSVLLSFWGTLIQRRQLCLTIEGDTAQAAAAPPVYPIRISASALVVGALGFFLCLALKTCQTVSAGSDCMAQRSAATNVWASILVLTAALVRLIDLVETERSRGVLTPPEAEELSLTEEEPAL